MSIQGRGRRTLCALLGLLLLTGALGGCNGQEPSTTEAVPGATTNAPVTTAPAAVGTTAVTTGSFATTEEITTEEEIYLMEPLTEYEEYIKYRTPLSNTYRKLTEDKELTVLYFGGSVTAGAGASDTNKTSWRALTGKWFENRFPEAEITNINRALGESGSYLGVHRVQDDVIAAEPDLIFLEYSINDRYYHSSYEQTSIQVETLIREIRIALPETEIVLVLVTDSTCLEQNQQGQLHTQAEAHERIANKYGLTTLHVGLALAKEANYDKAIFESEYATDIVHLTDKGYEVYYRVIREFLYNSLYTIDYRKVDEEMPTPNVYNHQLFDGDRRVIRVTEELLAESERLGGSGVTCDPTRLFTGNTVIQGVLFFDNPSDAFVLSFEGTEIAMFSSPVQKQIYYVSVDGGEEVTITGIGHNPVILARGLASGAHTVRVRVGVTQGTVQCGPFFVRDETKATLRGTPFPD